MSIGPTEGVPGAGRVERPRLDRGMPPAAPAHREGADRVEISETARLLAQLAAMPQIRQERVEELRRQLETGQLETPERLQKAIEAFLRENAELV